MTEFRKGGKQQKGEVVSPRRLRMLELLAGEMASGATPQEMAFELDIDMRQAQKAFWELRDVGHVTSLLLSWPERGGIRALFFLPANEDKARARAAEIALKVGAEKPKRVHAFDAMREEPPPADPRAVVPDRAHVWRQPVQPAGFRALQLGSYLPGDSWAARALAERRA